MSDRKTEDNEDNTSTQTKLLSALLFTSVGIVIGLCAEAVKAKEPDIYGEIPINQLQELPLEGISLQAKRFAEALRIPTISHDVENISEAALRDLLHHIKSAYPLIHSSDLVSYETVNEFSLLYTVRGSDPSLTPYLLASHLDVVPINEPTWSYPAFQGIITTDGEIVGRGAIDDKHGVFGILEALTFILENSYEPKRTIYIAFGHDEEVSGAKGAAYISARLKEKGVDQLQYILDEGTFLVENAVMGISKPIAIIGVSEKQRLDLEVSVHGEAGHSSIPGSESPITILSKAITRLNEHPHPNQFGQQVDKDFFKYSAYAASYPFKLIYSNVWIFSWLLGKIMGQRLETNALIRTTTAFTIFKSGYKSNVLPSKATAIINHRIHPASTVEDVIEYNRYIMDDNRINFRILETSQTTPQSPYGPGVEGFTTIAATIKQIYPDAVVAPAVLMGATDTVWYGNFTKCIYRFSPVLMTLEETKRFHGDDELITVDNYHRVITFYYNLIINSDKAATLNKENKKTKEEL